MTTSITDARYSALHQTHTDILAFSFDDPPETGWSVMPGFDESIPIPPHLEPPRLDADETLPSQVHPSYPFGRPSTGSGVHGKGRRLGVGKKVGNLLGTVGDGFGRGLRVESGADGRRGREDGWDESGMWELMDRERKKEIPPGMAGAKRPPTPPPSSLRPSQLPPPRSLHLRRQQERQEAQDQPITHDQFDAPVPNETYEEGQEPRSGRSGEGDRSGDGEWEGQLQEDSDGV